MLVGLNGTISRGKLNLTTEVLSASCPSSCPDCLIRNSAELIHIRQVYYSFMCLDTDSVHSSTEGQRSATSLSDEVVSGPSVCLRSGLTLSVSDNLQ